MTEKEAIKKVKEFGLYHAIGDLPNSALTVKAFKMAVAALEEIQQYRTIGTVEEIKRMQRYSALAKKHSTIGQVIDSCAEYEAIGTVEECRDAREKQRAKKPLQGEPYTWTSSVRVRGRYRDVQKTSYHHVCPNCRENVAMDMSCCKYCGQAINWSETV